ncbi:amidase signature domain-containing protein [Plectosphaerella plurivora]|uniref:Amidase signature domain-containing protein n=1 Tax=Plectosphaerella plurivora TaxID=936078 RepID=A0A9P8V1F7_9PEZI|nr:amidase signature domain-containing protein [Plectosphaerella plurivora]
MAVSTNWEKNVALKRQHRASLIPLHWQVRDINKDELYRPLETLHSSGVLTHEELALTDLTHDATSTLSRIASGELTAETVVTAYCKRAAAADSLTNFITEVNFNQAIRRAKELDQHFRETGSPVGPLHGLPFTVKDHMNVQGLDTSNGIASLCFDPAASNGLLVQILVDAGAVVIAKTNMPQTGFCADTDSVVFGRTLNAHNSLFGAGGPSGGEGSALGMGGSLFGLGSDGAGSARMPAMANGVVGYRPSGYRLPADGRSPFDPGMIGITQLGPVATFGLMGHSVRDIRTVSKIVADAEPWEKDPFLYPHPWLGISAPAKPRIGVWVPDVPTNLFHLFPPVLRGYLAAQERLRNAGFELVELKAPDVTGVWYLCKEMLHVQGVKGLTRLISEEPHTTIVTKTGIIGLPRWSESVSLEDVQDANVRLATLNVLMRQAWNASGTPLDALLSVTSPNPALPLHEWTDTTFTAVYNCTDWPAIVLPLGMRCDQELDQAYTDFFPFEEKDAQLQALYEPEKFHGLPLAVQLAGQKFQDEKLLAIAELIHPIIRGE